MTTIRNSMFLLALILSLTGVACQRSQATSSSAPNTGGLAQAATAATAAPAPAPQKLTRVVFVGKENACECTRKTVDAGWATLQTALGTPAKLPVEQVQIDTEAERVEPYRKQKPIMALPAIYFLDGNDVVVELLQGEVTEAQIAAILKGK
jgi:hypothetical protein